MKSTRTSILALTGIFLICSSITQPASQSYQLIAPTLSADPYAQMTSKEIKEHLVHFEKASRLEQEEYNLSKRCYGLTEKQAKFLSTCCPITATTVSTGILCLEFLNNPAILTATSAELSYPTLCAGWTLACTCSPIGILLAVPRYCVDCYFIAFPYEMTDRHMRKRIELKTALKLKQEDATTKTKKD